MSKNIHFGSPSDPSQTAAAEAKLRYVYSNLKPHGQSSKIPVRLLLSKVKPSYVYSILKPHGQSSRSPFSWSNNKMYIGRFRLSKLNMDIKDLRKYLYCYIIAIHPSWLFNVWMGSLSNTEDQMRLRLWLHIFFNYPQWNRICMNPFEGLLHFCK